MKLKQLEQFLQSLDGFESPKIKLEQYETPAHIATRVLYTALTTFQDLEGQMVADLGCGCGMLGIGAALLGATHVVGFELDKDALEICLNNISETEVSSMDLVNTDVLSIDVPDSRWYKTFDTVIMNPPFGTKRNQGVDIAFLRAALEMSSSVVYSFHKTATREYIQKKAKDWGVNIKVVAQLRYNLTSTYKFHKKNAVDIEVDFIRFTHG